MQIQHCALVNFLTSMQREPGIASTDILLALTTLSFDIAGLELYLPLTVGARVVIAPTERTADGKQLSALMQRCGATIMQATPATWRLLLDSGWEGSPRLKILCGGESWQAELAEELLPRCRSLWNMYGPTETTIWSSVSRVERDEPVLIGPPIANTTFYILDGCGQPLPIGIAGELHIGGRGLAAGYLGRAELTNERFVADPFSSQSGAKLYRTGDMVRRLQGGKIEFLCRVDHQVKLRGFRIELGEIESSLEQHPGIRQCVITVQGDELAEKRLVAYVVPEDPRSVPTMEDMRNALKLRLPSYMIPSIFVVIEEMPLTSNGKIDRKALQLSTPAANLSEAPGEAPRDPVEAELVQIWEQILGVHNPGVRDNFFESGGHSLLAMRLSSEINKRFSISLPLRALFFSPTIETQARLITENIAQSVHDLIIPIQKGNASRPPFFLIHSYHLNAILPQRLGSDQPFYGVQEYSPEDRVGNWSLDAMMSSYVKAIRLVAPHGPYFIGGFCSAALPALEVARQLQEAGEAVPLLVIIDSVGRLPEHGFPKGMA